MSSPPKIPEIIVESPVTQRKFPAVITAMNPPSTTGRNKVAVTHGHSMANWVQKVSREKVKAPSNRIISHEELMQHNSRGDGWTVLRGKVFDVTDYIDYHPGGVSILLKVLGQDGTKQFNAIHNYVNFDSILKNRQVGFYIPPAAPSSSNKGSLCCAICGGSNVKSEHIPVTSFEQDDTTVTYTVECKCMSMDKKYWSIGVSDKKTLMVKAVTTPPEIWLSHLTLTEKLEDDALQLTFENQFKKMILKLTKPSPTKWKSLGIPGKNHNGIMDSSEAPKDYYDATIVFKDKLSEDNYLFGICVGPEVYMGVPIGWHVMFKIGDVEKPYTPVGWMTPQHAEAHEEIEKNCKGEVFKFLIKTHNNGRLTGPLNTIELNEEGSLQMGAVRGFFNTAFLVEIDRLILIAGGTGIAPFVNMLLHIKERREELKVKQVVLFFSARSFDDLLWNDVWKSLKNSDWFYYFPYITRGKPPPDFPCSSGRVSVEGAQHDLASVPKPDNVTETMLTRGMACGPACFTDSCLTIFQSLGMKDYEFILFDG